jgi:hypothetical protein
MAKVRKSSLNLDTNPNVRVTFTEEDLQPNLAEWMASVDSLDATVVGTGGGNAVCSRMPTWECLEETNDCALLAGVGCRVAPDDSNQLSHFETQHRLWHPLFADRPEPRLNSADRAVEVAIDVSMTRSESKSQHSAASRKSKSSRKSSKSRSKSSRKSSKSRSKSSRKSSKSRSKSRSKSSHKTKIPRKSKSPRKSSKSGRSRDRQTNNTPPVVIRDPKHNQTEGNMARPKSKSRSKSKHAKSS